MATASRPALQRASCFTSFLYSTLRSVLPNDDSYPKSLNSFGAFFFSNLCPKKLANAAGKPVATELDLWTDSK